MGRVDPRLSRGAATLALLVVSVVGLAPRPAGATECWRRFPGQATYIEFGADGSIWATDTNNVSSAGGYGVMRWNGEGWVHVDGSVRAMHGLAVGPQGEPWIVTNRSEIFRLVDGRWQRMPGLAYDISSGGDGSIWILGTNEAPGGWAIYRWNGSDWSPVDGGATLLDVDAAGQAWVRNWVHTGNGFWSGTIYRRVGDTWQPWTTDGAMIFDLAGGGIPGRPVTPFPVWRILYRPAVGTNGVEGWFLDRWWTTGAGMRVNVDMSGRAWHITGFGDIFQLVTFCA